MVASKSKFKDWNVGNILGRNKDGFQQVNTDERDGMLDDDSDSEVSSHLVSISKNVIGKMSSENFIGFIEIVRKEMRV